MSHAPSLVDLPRARRALDALDVLALSHPELVDFTAAGPSNVAAWAADLEAEMSSKRTPDGSSVVRVPGDLLARADALIPDLRERPEVRAVAWGEITRSAVVRLALVHGLAFLEEQAAAGARKEKR